MKPDPDALDPAFSARLTAYLDGELSPVEARAFLDWLEVHPEALKCAEESRRVWALLSAYADEPVPEGFAERVLAKTTGVARAASGASPDAVAERAPTWRVLSSPARWGGRSRAFAAAAAVLVAVGAGVLALRSRTGPASDPAASAALEAVPADLLEGDAIASLASLSDEEFEAMLAADLDTLPVDASKDRGG